MEGSCGHRRAENFVDGWLEIAAVEEPYDDELQSTFFTGNGSSPALALFDAGVRLARFPLESSNFIFVFAFQGGIIHHFSRLFLGLALRFVKLTLDCNFGA